MNGTGYGRTAVLFLTLLMCHCGTRQKAAPKTANASGQDVVYATPTGPEVAAEERTTVSLFALKRIMDGVRLERVVQKRLSEHQLPGSIKQLEWVDRERLAILLSSGQIFVLEGGKLQEIPAPPKSVWDVKNPGEGYGHQEYPARAGLIASEDGRFLLADCPYYVEGDGDCCHTWVYVDLFSGAKRSAPEEKVRRPFPRPEGKPGEGLALRMVPPVMNEKQELEKGPSFECLKNGNVVTERAYDVTEYGEYDLEFFWLGPGADSYLVLSEEVDISGEKCTGLGDDFVGKIRIARACEEAEDIPVYSVQWGPSGYWAYHATGDDGPQVEDAERWRLALYGVVLRYLNIPGKPVFRP